jgi:hypothetical protein
VRAGPGRHRHLHAHHNDDFADHGSKLDEGVWLCPEHHRLVHRLGYRIRRDPDGTIPTPTTTPVEAATPTSVADVRIPLARRQSVRGCAPERWERQPGRAVAVAVVRTHWWSGEWGRLRAKT